MIKNNWFRIQVPSAAFGGLAMIFFTVSLLLITDSPQSFLYDETFYHQYATDLAKKGFGIAYLQELGAPTGPLYGIVHIGLSWFTKLEILPMRLATDTLFLLCALTTAALLFMLKEPNSTSIPALAYGIPFAGVTFGLSLTEVPAMMAASLGTFALVIGLKIAPGDNTFRKSSFIAFVLAGLLYSFSVWGRQNYLVILLAIPAAFCANKRFLFIPCFLVMSVACFLSVALFLVWGGLVPEAVRFVASPSDSPVRGGMIAGINLIHGFYGLGYAAVLFCVLSPGIFVLKARVVLLCGTISLLAIILSKNLCILPSRFLLERLLGNWITEVFGILFGLGFSFLGLWLLASVMVRCCQAFACRTSDAQASPTCVGSQGPSPARRPNVLQLNDQIYIFASLAWLLILASNMKVLHQFSSRYVVVAVPFMLVTAARHFEPNLGAIIRLVCGFGISMLFLINYYGWF